jgi:hypothetical protein
MSSRKKHKPFKLVQNNFIVITMGSRYHTVRTKKRPGKTRSEKVRPKTFKTEEAAKQYAQENGISKYVLENMKSPEASEKKIRIVEE